MPDCHKCPYDGKGSNKCIHCPGPSMTQNNHGLTRLSIDNKITNNANINNRLEYYISSLKDRKENKIEKKIEKLGEFFRFWLSLPYQNQRIVSIILSTPSITPAELAREYKCARSTMFSRLTVLAKKNAAFAEILKCKMRSLRK